MYGHVSVLISELLKAFLVFHTDHRLATNPTNLEYKAVKLKNYTHISSHLEVSFNDR